MFMKIAFGIAVGIAAVLIFAATRPDSFRVSRSAAIQAPPEKIFALIDDFHNWIQWSPYENMDPNMKRTYAGTASGVGTIYEWEGQKSGQGRMEIIRTVPALQIVIRLDFIAPFKANNTAEFTLDTHGEITEVTWAMYGRNNYLAKLMGLFFNMDTLIGKDFERGLLNLKTIAERTNQNPAMK